MSDRGASEYSGKGPLHPALSRPPPSSESYPSEARRRPRGATVARGGGVRFQRKTKGERSREEGRRARARGCEKARESERRRETDGWTERARKKKTEWE